MIGRSPTSATILVLSLALVGGCKQQDPPPKPPAAGLVGVATGVNVLLLTLDTTRADRLGCYGHQQARTPELDDLATGGARFEQAFAQVPITLPSHAVLLTGTHPPENGVRDNQRYALGPELTTLGEMFQRHGYRTGAFIAAGVLNARHGLDRGFDVYDDYIPRFQRPANEVCDAALDWLAQPSEKPFFAWVHFYDPHWPYEPPPDFADAGSDPYDGEIAFMDAQVGRLLAWLRAGELYDQTLVVAVGDHGESLGEHGYDWHALLVYDGIMRVPLIFSLPGKLPAGTTISGLAGIVDIAPTILDLMGWQTPAEVSGESLVQALDGRELPARKLYGESDFPYENFSWSKLRCLIGPRWKYIRAPRGELYDRINDPGESHNIAEAHPDIVTRMEEELGDWEYRMPVRESAAVTVDSDSLAALRSLGYVGAPPPLADPDADLKDPKDMVDIANNHRIAEGLLGRHQADEALALVEPAARRSPESFVLVELLGKCYAGAGLLDFAQLTLRDALAIQPKAPDTWLFLARVMQARGALAGAIRACDQALALDPDHKQARALAPELNTALDQQQANLAELRGRLAEDPESIETRLALAQELAASGDAPQAVQVLREALDKGPRIPLLANALAWLLATTPRDELRDPAAAVRWAELAVSGELAANPGAVDTLAAALAAAGDFDQAATAARRATELAEQAGDARLARNVARRLELYEAKRSFRLPE